MADEKPTSPRDEAEARAKDVASASGQASIAWISFISLCAYLGVAFGSTTPRNLLLEEPIALPLLATIPLPLVAFYVVAAAALLLAHSYLLFQIRLLAYNVQLFDAAFAALPSADQPILRGKLHGLLFTRLFSQSSGDGVVRTVAFVGGISTAILLPLVILLLGQAQFLKYHSVAITWWHRSAILVDLALLWVAWPSGVAKAVPNVYRPRQLRVALMRLKEALPAGRVASFAGTLAVVGWILFVATIPGETFFDRTTVVDGVTVAWWPTRTLFEGGIDRSSRRPTSPFTRNIVLFSASLVPKDCCREGEVSVDLHGRDLRNAVLADADLSHADLQSANLRGADLRGALLTRARLDGVNLSHAVLDSGSFNDASFIGATLDHVSARGASFRRASLQASRLFDVDATDADFSGANLERALFLAVQMNGSKFIATRAKSVWFMHVTASQSDLTASDFENAVFFRASIPNATFDAANLLFAKVLNSNFEQDSFRGAILLFVSTDNTVADDSREASGGPCPKSVSCNFYLADLRAVNTIVDLSILRSETHETKDAVSRELIRRELARLVKNETLVNATELSSAADLNTHDDTVPSPDYVAGYAIGDYANLMSDYLVNTACNYVDYYPEVADQLFGRLHPSLAERKSLFGLPQALRQIQIYTIRESSPAAKPYEAKLAKAILSPPPGCDLASSLDAKSLGVLKKMLASDQVSGSRKTPRHHR